MKTTHTPGPWFANKSELEACSSMVSIRTENGGYEITKDVGYQNAPLIAAAPELLAALRACSKYLELAFSAEGDVFGVHHNAATDAISTAQVAINKAMGKS